MPIADDGQYPESPPTELSFVQSLRIRVKVRSHLAIKARLPHVLTGDRHCAAVDLYEETPSRPVRKADTEHEVRHDADLDDTSRMGHFYPEGQRIAHASRRLGERRNEIAGGNEENVSSFSRCLLQSDIELRHFQLVFQEGPASPFVIACASRALGFKQTSAAIRQRVHHRL